VALNSVLSIEDSLATTEAEGASALIQLYKALGGGWSPMLASRTARATGNPS
jgi:outer membrane protein TolC